MHNAAKQAHRKTSLGLPVLDFQPAPAHLPLTPNVDKMERVIIQKHDEALKQHLFTCCYTLKSKQCCQAPTSALLKGRGAQLTFPRCSNGPHKSAHLPCLEGRGTVSALAQ